MTPGPRAATSAYSPSTNALNAGASTVSSAERTITISLTFSGPRRRSSNRVSACLESGLPVKPNSLVRASLRRLKMRATETAKTATQAPTTSQGRRALARASASVDSFRAIGSPFRMRTGLYVACGAGGRGDLSLATLKSLFTSESTPRTVTAVTERGLCRRARTSLPFLAAATGPGCTQRRRQRLTGQPAAVPLWLHHHAFRDKGAHDL